MDFFFEIKKRYVYQPAHMDTEHDKQQAAYDFNNSFSAEKCCPYY